MINQVCIWHGFEKVFDVKDVLPNFLGFHLENLENPKRMEIFFTRSLKYIIMMNNLLSY